MHKFLSVFLCLFIANFSFSQVVGGSNEKLAKLYNSGKYEACLLKAENVTFDEKTKKDPEAYLYMSMCFYQLSKSEDAYVAEEYKKGFKDAIKYISKFAKYDKEGEMYADNEEYINEIKDIQFKSVKTFYDEQNFKKAASEAKQYNKLNREEDFTILLFTGMCEVMSGNSQGSRNIDEATLELENQLKAGSVRIDKRFKTLIGKCIVIFAELKEKEGENKASKSILELGSKVLPDDAQIKSKLK